MIYGERSNGKEHGLVLTKPVVVDKMLQLAEYHPMNDLRNTKIVEPAAGDGAFAIPIINVLHESSVLHGFDFQAALCHLKFFEIADMMFDRLKANITSRLSELGCTLPNSLLEKCDFLTSDFGKVDVIIGNPPYVRHENIPDIEKGIYRKEFGTFTHRSDLYIAFFEKGLRHLNEDGFLSFICSNRWLKNQYGERLRNYIHSGFELLEVIDLESASPFEEEVIAYPAIINIRKSRNGIQPKYFEFEDIKALNRFSRNNTPDRILATGSSNWFVNMNNGEPHHKFLDSIENQGFKIGIGVATGCDKVFIREDFPELVEKELLLPILTSRDVKNNKLDWGGKYILNPFDVKGNLINLNEYPKASDYLNANSTVLKNRHVAKKNTEKWYKTIDKINYGLTFESKIILPDISGNTHILIDDGNYYPHHNLYYITGGSQEELTLLAAILMSDFARDQLSEFGNKMNGGYPRWQSQNLRKLLLPVISAIPEMARIELVKAYETMDVNAINKLITPEKISQYEVTSGQTVLFEPDERKSYLKRP
jgi:adenine-specific DNA-methyltransferase